ncbi:MAG: hypothetical protein JNM72_23290 [Deltaproteobacteria bacterium]|jgi:hypothetical protein|nr:hypothetical protein [Deltaproteobacteria bacterium]
MSDAHAFTWLAVDVDKTLVATGQTPQLARATAALIQLPVDREHHPGVDPAEVGRQVDAWAASLRVVRLELHGDQLAVRAVLLHLATELPELMLLPALADPLRRGAGAAA